MISLQIIYLMFLFWCINVGFIEKSSAKLSPLSLMILVSKFSRLKVWICYLPSNITQFLYRIGILVNLSPSNNFSGSSSSIGNSSEPCVDTWLSDEFCKNDEEKCFLGFLISWSFLQSKTWTSCRFWLGTQPPNIRHLFSSWESYIDSIGQMVKQPLGFNGFSSKRISYQPISGWWRSILSIELITSSWDVPISVELFYLCKNP